MKLATKANKRSNHNKDGNPRISNGASDLVNGHVASRRCGLCTRQAILGGAEVDNSLHRKTPNLLRHHRPSRLRHDHPPLVALSQKGRGPVCQQERLEIVIGHQAVARP